MEMLIIIALSILIIALVIRNSFLDRVIDNLMAKNVRSEIVRRENNEYWFNKNKDLHDELGIREAEKQLVIDAVKKAGLTFVETPPKPISFKLKKAKKIKKPKKK